MRDPVFSRAAPLGSILLDQAQSSETSGRLYVASNSQLCARFLGTASAPSTDAVGDYAWTTGRSQTERV